MTEITLAAILPSRLRTRPDPAQAMLEHYLARAAKLQPCHAASFPSEAQLWETLDRQAARTPVRTILFDPAGRLITSEDLAAQLGGWRDAGTQRIVLAIGPPDGWSAGSRERASAVLSFGRITLPHELARIVAAEQLYRALTILAGHPYHRGH